MGTFFVEALLAAPGRPERRQPVELLVDSGSTYTWVAGALLRALSVAPTERRRVVTIEGQVAERDAAEVLITPETTQGKINFHEWIGNGWAILFSHPKDFTPVCTTELGYMAGLKPQFDKRNCKIIGLSVDPVADHQRWSKDIEETQGHAVTYPMIGDPELKVAKAYDMLPEGSGTTSQGRTAADNATVRSVFVIGPDKK